MPDPQNKAPGTTVDRQQPTEDSPARLESAPEMRPDDDRARLHRSTAPGAIGCFQPKWNRNPQPTPPFGHVSESNFRLQSGSIRSLLRADAEDSFRLCIRVRSEPR